MCVRAWCSDEPTTGMDPVNRTTIWEVIRALKPGRIVVLTTHNMEEADYLGDTVALMSNGRSVRTKTTTQWSGQWCCRPFSMSVIHFSLFVHAAAAL